MCMFKSGIILKDRVFVPDYDSHTEMLEELKIADTRNNAEKLFVRAELIPKNGDIFSSVDDWEFRVDQDIIPDWFVKNYEEQRMKGAVKKWAESHIYIGVDDLKLPKKGVYYLKNCKRVTCENSTVTAWGNSTVTARGNSTVTARENSTVTKTQFSSFDTDKLILCDNATFKDCYSKVIWQSGEWELRTINGKG